MIISPLIAIIIVARIAIIITPVAVAGMRVKSSF